MDISKVDPEKLFSLYSIVFQDVTLFNNTIMENIRVGCKNATDDEVLQAARYAYCDEFAEKLPEGWNTMIGENGSELSGADKIVVLNHGNVAEQGKPAVLIEQCGMYRKMVELQNKAQSWSLV